MESRYHQYSLASSPWLPSGPVRPKIRSFRIGSRPFQKAKARHSHWRWSQMPAEPVLVPAVGARAGVVVGEGLPGIAVGAVVLAHGGPGPLGQVRAPAEPRQPVGRRAAAVPRLPLAAPPRVGRPVRRANLGVSACRTGGRGGTGRRAGFRSRCRKAVGVRVPPPAPPMTNTITSTEPAGEPAAGSPRADSARELAARIAWIAAWMVVATLGWVTFTRAGRHHLPGPAHGDAAGHRPDRVPARLPDRRRGLPAPALVPGRRLRAAGRRARRRGVPGARAAARCRRGPPPRRG